uniref:Uncharacterized protein n=1 Tax=Anguilla anguilla TaxID=7936 RepID=A0A0E9S2T9_ANGAN
MNCSDELACKLVAINFVL